MLAGVIVFCSYCRPKTLNSHNASLPDHKGYKFVQYTVCTVMYLFNGYLLIVRETYQKCCGPGGGGVLRYTCISDGDVRSPFLGLKFAI